MMELCRNSVDKNHSVLEYVSSADTHCKQVLNTLNEDRISSDIDRSLCDGILIVQNTRFHVHKCILAANSLYFRTMFHGGRFVEGCLREITIEGVSRDAMSILLDVMYGNSLRISTDSVYDVIAAADLFLMDAVKNLCVEFLLHVLKSPLCRKETLKIWRVGDLFDIDELVKSACQIMYDDFASVCKSEAFMELSYEELDRILASDNITTKEHVIFEAVVSWIQNNSDYRVKYLDCLMEKVRFPLMEPEKLLLLVVKEEILVKSTVCINLLDEAKQYILLPKMQSVLQSPRTKPRFRKNSNIIYMLSGLQHFKCYIPSQQKWYSLQSPDVQNLESSTFQISLLCVNSDVYCSISSVFNDEVGRHNLIQLQKYNISENCWRHCSLPGSSSNITLIENTGILYACSRNSLEVYNSKSNSWTCLANWDLDPYQFLISDDQAFYFFNFVEGVAQKVCLRDLKVSKHQFFMPNKFIVAVQDVVKLRSHQVFIFLRTLAGVSWKTFNFKSYQWKNANISMQDRLLRISDDALYHVKYDRTDDLMFVLYNSPYLPQTVDDPKTLKDGVLPFFSVELRTGKWERLPCLPEYLSDSQINMCIYDNENSKATT